MDAIEILEDRIEEEKKLSSYFNLKHYINLWFFYFFFCLFLKNFLAVLKSYAIVCCVLINGALSLSPSLLMWILWRREVLPPKLDWIPLPSQVGLQSSVDDRWLRLGCRLLLVNGSKHPAIVNCHCNENSLISGLISVLLETRQQPL